MSGPSHRPGGGDVPPRFAPGARVRIRDDWPEERGPCHIRTPHYVRGRTGTVERALGAYPNPEDLAFARPAPRRALYHVRFDQKPLWDEGNPRDSVLIEIYEHWLEPAPEGKD
jgi:nitrile hydratase